MREFVQKLISKDIIFVILIGAFLFGLVKYIDFRLDSIEKQVAFLEQQNEDLGEKNKKDIKDIFDIILGSQDGLVSVLEQQKVQNADLANQFEKITDTVGTLEKLSETDPELLKKYSKVYFLNEHYVPVSLSEIGTDYRFKTSTNYQINSEVLAYLEKLIEAGNADGFSVRAQSAYRSYSTQAVLKGNYTVTYGAGANKFSADQGYSEHQLGTTVDFTTVKTEGALSGFDKTPEYTWLLENAYKFGFVISYPSGNSYYKFEPWHWRFVGVELATKLHEDGKHFYDVDQRFIDSYLIKLFD